ncbi:LPXTG-motif cell wall anchor domain-containing protein/MYXO-CTERM domain-containing protein [Lentzea fradiae]|uniref:LPXTG-motif cell wall anchor domain-containing protein/MYXO-CTERM domain-containing protein n=1 Tax=Lentzea fradiae TaxID=200378 RepID=A0A1G7STZ8_9PSEU|nr:WGxxGxxG family protein [Lentzea fradiae]SDG26362.1 LPXTG-motif cell wall anchor domain-containing protein/MYXO-CTERM domain-containing protein [Lentzea fradiae]
MDTAKRLIAVLVLGTALAGAPAASALADEATPRGTTVVTAQDNNDNNDDNDSNGNWGWLGLLGLLGLAGLAGRKRQQVTGHTDRTMGR